MLYLVRKLDESIIINGNIEVKVIEIRGKSVKLGFEFPSSAQVLRKEVFDRIAAENIAASMSGTTDDSFADDLVDAISRINPDNDHKK